MKFVKYPTDIMEMAEISVYAKQVWCGLKSHENQKTGQCNPSLKTLARSTGLSRSTVLRSTQELEAAGLLIISKRHKKVNNYTLLTPSGIPQTPDDTQSGIPQTPKPPQSGIPQTPDLVSDRHPELYIREKKENYIYRDKSQPVEQALEIFKNYWREVMGFEYVTQSDDLKTIGIILAGLRGDFQEYELRVSRYLKRPPNFSGKYKVKLGIANFHKYINNYGKTDVETSGWKDYYDRSVK